MIEVQARSIQQLNGCESPVDCAHLSGQVTVLEERKTSTGKLFYDLGIADATGELKLKVWDNNPAFKSMGDLRKGVFIRIEGGFVRSEFGWESKWFEVSWLDDDAIAKVIEGPAELREKQERDWLALQECVSGSPDGPLKELMQWLLTVHEVEFRRAGAARGNHHARRGGLVEHVSLMAQAAVALCGVYRELRRDLLVAGVLFHDIGKIVENQYEEQGFEISNPCSSY